MAERDKDYDAFYAKWKPRLGLKDRHLALGYMRGLGQEYSGLAPDPSKVSVFIRVDGIGIDAQMADDGSLEQFVAMWSEMIEDQKDKRKFTKDIVCETVALHLHLGDRGPYLVAAALWLAADSEAFEVLRERPGKALLCEFTLEGETGRRFRLSILDEAPEAI